MRRNTKCGLATSPSDRTGSVGKPYLAKCPRAIQRTRWTRLSARRQDAWPNDTARCLDTLGTCLDHAAEVAHAGASISRKSRKVRHFVTRRTSNKAPESLSKPLSYRSQSQQIGKFVFKNFPTRITRSVKKSTPRPVFRLELYSGHLEMV